MAWILPAIPSTIYPNQVDEDFEYDINLDNGSDIAASAMHVRFFWNQRTQGWYWDLSTADRVAILTGARLNPGAYWFFAVTDPPGQFVCAGSDGYQQNDLGTSLLLLYYPPGEVTPPPEPMRMTLG